MSEPAYRFSTRIGDQPQDAAGRRWFVKELLDAAIGGADVRAELLARALLREGGVAVRPTLLLVGTVATLTGPIVAVSRDGLAPMLLDPAGAGISLALATLSDGFADGRHSIVARATPVSSSLSITTPAIAVRDPQGNIVQTTASETLAYVLRSSVGALVLLEGEAIEDTDALIATVDLASGVFSDLVAAGDAPKLRARLEDLEDVDATSRLDGYLLAWDEGTQKHVYVSPGTPAPGSGSGS